MIAKIKSFISGRTARVTASTMAVATGLLAGSNAFAAVDLDVEATTGLVVNTMKENVIGVITANIANIVIVGVIIFSIGFVWRLSRRFMR